MGNIKVNFKLRKLDLNNSFSVERTERGKLRNRSSQIDGLVVDQVNEFLDAHLIQYEVGEGCLVADSYDLSGGKKQIDIFADVGAIGTVRPRAESLRNFDLVEGNMRGITFSRGQVYYRVRF